MKTRRQQAGDTIIEVMISMAILGLVLTGAYVTANHSYLNVFSAQEREEAILLAQSQVEIMSTQSAGTLGTYPSFCFSNGAVSSAATAACSQGANNQYVISITSVSPRPSPLTTYQVSITWPRPGGDTDNLVMYYQPETV